MKEHPRTFSAEMVRALLAGSKTETRRVIRPQPEIRGGYVYGMRCAGGEHFLRREPWHFDARSPKPGDRLWVRETHAIVGGPDSPHPRVIYRATETDWCAGSWRPSIHMPRWASRITLEVTAVRAELLQEITEQDARVEGAEMYVMGHGPITDMDLAVEPGYWSDQLYRTGFRSLWYSINAKRGYEWDANPWVRVETFRKEAGR